MTCQQRNAAFIHKRRHHVHVYAVWTYIQCHPPSPYMHIFEIMQEGWFIHTYPECSYHKFFILPQNMSTVWSNKLPSLHIHTVVNWRCKSQLRKYLTTCTMTPVLKTTVGWFIVHFSCTKTPPYKDHLSTETTITWSLEWSLQTCFTVLHNSQCTYHWKMSSWTFSPIAIC
jgi:hypothetical protein